MKKLAIFVITLLVIACGNNDIDPYDQAAQLTIDLENIDSYLKMQGITPNVDGATSIRYVITQVGDGTGADIGDIVEVNYALYNFQGELIDTNIIEVARDEGILGTDLSRYVPFKFTVGEAGIIIGFSRSVELLSTTGSGDFYIPSVYAYQNRGSGNIAPNESLLFQIELLEVLD